MRVISRRALNRFAAKFPEALLPLNLWYSAAMDASWRNFSEVRGAMGQTDVTRVASGNTVAIFDIGGNKFRLIARISYERQKLYVLKVMTHKEYDKDIWKDQL
jgi:mRNA interferase HigB